MTETQEAFTIDSFYRFIGQGKLMGAECRQCSKIIAPPRPMCPHCFSQDLQWTELPTQGTLLTYTIIHIAPERFQDLTPYPVAIIKLQDGVHLPGILKVKALDTIHIGMSLTIGFEQGSSEDEWPNWPRYYFKPMT